MSMAPVCPDSDDAYHHLTVLFTLLLIYLGIEMGFISQYNFYNMVSYILIWLFGLNNLHFLKLHHCSPFFKAKIKIWKLGIIQLIWHKAITSF